MLSKDSLSELVDLTVTNLRDDLKTIINEKAYHYDILYEEFIKLFELYKIKILKELRVIMIGHDTNMTMASAINGYTPDSKKEKILLYQMKHLLTNKIRVTIDKANQEKNTKKKQELLELILTLNESLQKVENNLLNGAIDGVIGSGLDDITSLSGLKAFEYGCIESFRIDNKDDDIVEHKSYLHSSDKKILTRSNTSAINDLNIITPLPYKIPKITNDSNITPSLTPLLSESAQNANKISFKTPNYFGHSDKPVLPNMNNNHHHHLYISSSSNPIDNDNDHERSIDDTNPHIHPHNGGNIHTIKNFTSNKTDNSNHNQQQQQLIQPMNNSEGEGGAINTSNTSGPSLFDMFDACLNSIVKPLNKPGKIGNEPKIQIIKRIISKAWFRKWSRNTRIGKTTSIQVNTRLEMSDKSPKQYQQSQINTQGLGIITTITGKANPRFELGQSADKSPKQHQEEQNIDSWTPKRFCAMQKTMDFSSDKKLEKQLDDRLLRHGFNMSTVEADEEDLLGDENPNFTTIFMNDEMGLNSQRYNNNNNNNEVMTFNTNTSIIEAYSSSNNANGNNTHDDSLMKSSTKSTSNQQSKSMNLKQKSDSVKLKTSNSNIGCVGQDKKDILSKKVVQNSGSCSNIDSRMNTPLPHKRTLSKDVVVGVVEKSDSKLDKAITCLKSTSRKNSVVRMSNNNVNTTNSGVKSMMKIPKNQKASSNKENINVNKRAA